MWKRYLEFSRGQLTVEASKWWFHLYGSCREQSQDDNGIPQALVSTSLALALNYNSELCLYELINGRFTNPALRIVIFASHDSGDKFVVSLQTFMEEANLGDFNTRLHIIEAFLAEMKQKGA